jgi:CHAT domain-containing protein/tetratricopeptide (TPR) repeat protein
MRRRLYKGDHPNLATSLNNLGSVFQSQGRLTEAEILLREALAMRRRLIKGDHPNLALSLNNLGLLLKDQGRLAEAEPLLRDALAIYRRLFRGDHPDLATSVNNMGILLLAQGRLAEAEPFYRDAFAMRKRLYKGDHPALALSLSNLGFLLTDQGRLGEAEPLLRDALAMRRRLLKGDHRDVAASLNNLGLLLLDQRKLEEAEPLLRDALAMRRRLFEGDHHDVAQSLNNLGSVFQHQGRRAEAEALYRETLAMDRRLYKGDHPALAASLTNLGRLLLGQGRLAEAEPLLREALAMHRRLYKGDHPNLAASLNNLGGLLRDQGNLAEAELLYLEALATCRRLYKGDHPNLAAGLSNMGFLLQSRGKFLEAEPFYRDGLAMLRRLFEGDHHDVARTLNNVGFLLTGQGKLAKAEPVYRDALAMLRRLANDYADWKSEGEALTLAASLPLTRDGFLSNARLRRSAPADSYVEVWASKAALARVFERRHLLARAAAIHSKAASLLTELADARRRRAELLLAPHSKGPATRKKREDDLQALADRIAELDRAVRPLLPAIARADKLARATPTDLEKLLPPDVAVIDFLAYTFLEWDKDKPGKAVLRYTPSYLAFVLTRDKITRVELGAARPIEDAVRLWRDAITGPSGRIPADIPAKVRELVWDKVRKELSAGIKAVYLSPDLALTALPWAALPGHRPGTVLLEDYALAVIPHAPFLLDKLWPADAPTARKPGAILTVGGVGYTDTPTRPAAKPDERLALRSGPALKEGQRLEWKALPAAAAEAKGVASMAGRRKLVPHLLSGQDASADRVLAELPKARFAHLATHGFFADASFRSVLQVDPKLFEMRGGERVGAGALSPMVMSGLVFAGANKPETPGRGLLTGEALIDRDLSGLELAVLSACETGLGDVAGGEGVFGLQRAFHVAGCRNVVASLWKVDDDATAALMAVFYRKLWQDNLPPAEALRQAQLEIYRNPGKVAELAKTLRGKFEVVKGSGGSGEAPAKPAAGGKAHPRLWAAFLLSGPGLQ